MLGDHLLCFGLNPCFENGSWGGGVSGHIFFGHTFLLLSCFAPGLKAVLLLHWSKADRKVLDGVFSWWKQLCSFVCMQCYFFFSYSVKYYMFHVHHVHLYVLVCLCIMKKRKKFKTKSFNYSSVSTIHKAPD